MAGLNAAEEQIKSIPGWDSKERENRVFFMTDMCIDPNGGDGKNLFGYGQVYCHGCLTKTVQSSDFQRSEFTLRLSVLVWTSTRR